MPRLDPLPMEELGDLAPMLQAMAAQTGYEMNSLKTLGRKPQIVETLMAFAGAVMAPGDVSPELKNMVSQIVSQAAGCGYCMAHTGHAGHGLDIAADKQAARWDFETSAPDRRTLFPPHRGPFQVNRESGHYCRCPAVHIRVHTG